MDIDYIANLAQIELSDEEKAKMDGQLDEILGYFEKLNAVNVESVESLAHARPFYNVWHQGDEAGPAYNPEVLIKMAPEQRDNQVVVPKVIE